MQYRKPLNGALIVEVIPGSPAAAAGLEPLRRSQFGAPVWGDLITAVGDTPIRQNEDLLCAVEEASPSEDLILTVMRGCDPKRVERVRVRPAARKTVRSAAGGAALGYQSPLTGVDQRRRR